MFEMVKAIHEALHIESTWAFVLVISVGFAIMSGSVAWVVDKGYRQSAEYKEEHSQKQHTLQSTAEPIIEPSYNLNLIGLPILVQPFKVIDLVLVRENRRVEMQRLLNDQNSDLIWPTKEKIFPPIQTGQIQLANNGNVAVFNVSYSITLQIGTQKGAGGVSSVSVNLPLVDLPVGARREFVVVNQSESFPAMVELSKTAMALVQGETERRSIEMRPRSITFFDKIPLLMTSFHKWSGNTIIEPNKTQKIKNKKRTDDLS